MLLKESVNVENEHLNTDYMKKMTNLIEDKRKGHIGNTLIKEHATSEFVIVVYNIGCALLCLASSLVSVVRLGSRQAGTPNLKFQNLFKSLYGRVCVLCF